VIGRLLDWLTVRPAAETWTGTCCALREQGVGELVVYVCARHDVELNESMVRLAYGPDAFREELAAYRESRLGEYK
jgi:hypothetical protein